MERIVATYLVETPIAVEKAAATLAGEQSSGTFVEVPGETAELKQRFAARVEKITPLETVTAPGLPGCRSSSRKIPTRGSRRLLARRKCGRQSPGAGFDGSGQSLRVVPILRAQADGPRLAAIIRKPFSRTAVRVAGLPKAHRVEGRPLIGTIIKPSIGLTPQQTAALVKTLAEAGIDFIKDDELMANPPHSPFDERVDAVMRVITPTPSARQEGDVRLQRERRNRTRCFGITTRSSHPAAPARWLA